MSFVDSEVTLTGGAKVATVLDTVTNRHYQKSVITGSGGQVLALAELENGDAFPVANYAEQVTIGFYEKGGDLTGGRPIYMGGMGTNNLNSPTPVTDFQLVPTAHARDGRLINVPIGPPEDQLATTTVVAVNATTSTELIAAQSKKIALWGLYIFNKHATTPAEIILQDGSGGTELRRCYCKPSDSINLVWNAPVRTNTGVGMFYALVAAPGANTVYMSPTAFKTAL